MSWRKKIRHGRGEQRIKALVSLGSFSVKRESAESLYGAAALRVLL